MTKGTDCTVLLDILKNILNENIFNTKEDILNEAIKKYNAYFKPYSTNTKWNIMREDAMVALQKNKCIKKLKQKGIKLDFITAYRNESQKIIIEFFQQKGNSGSQNSTSKPATYDNIADCIKNKTYLEFFNILPDDLNPLKNNEDYEIDFFVGYGTAIGYSNCEDYDGVKITTLCGDEYRQKLGLESTDFEISSWILDNYKDTNYDAVNKCKDWNNKFDEFYENVFN
jgi:hypothetical protein